MSVFAVVADLLRAAELSTHSITVIRLSANTMPNYKVCFGGDFCLLCVWHHQRFKACGSGLVASSTRVDKGVRPTQVDRHYLSSVFFSGLNLFSQPHVQNGWRRRKTRLDQPRPQQSQWQLNGKLSISLNFSKKVYWILIGNRTYLKCISTMAF